MIGQPENKDLTLTLTHDPQVLPQPISSLLQHDKVMPRILSQARRALQQHRPISMATCNLSLHA